MKRSRAVTVTAGFVLAALAMLSVVLEPGHGPKTAEAAGALPPGFPSTLQLGMMDSPGGAATMKATAPFGFRYQYLAAGVNTGNGWAHWNPNGAFVTYYIQDSIANGITPVFTYYQIRMSSPGDQQEEISGVLGNLQNSSTMTAYWNDLKLFYQRAGAFPNNRVILHVEPDMWGYIQARYGDNAANGPAKVGSTGLPELAGLPDNMSGFARAVIKLRDTYAPNVTVGYAMSIWGTGIDIQVSKPSDAQVDALATRAGNFYTSLGANFDVTFGELDDRDAGYNQVINGDGGISWFSAADYGRHARFFGKFSEVAQKRMVLWQIPVGNTRMRAMNNTWNHFQDNKVEWFLDDAGRSHLQAFIDAGVIALLFGRGADGATCFCDAAGDGVTNPAAINGNTLSSLNADDDGGFFRQKAAAYYAQGAMPLAGGSTPTATPTSAAPTSTPTATNTTVASTPTATPTSAPPTATPTRTATQPAPTATPTRTATPVATPTVPSSIKWTVSGSTSSNRVNRGQAITLRASVRANASVTALVDIEVYNSSGQKVHQVWWDNQALTANQTRTFSASWQLPSNLPPGQYTLKVGVFKPNWASMYAWNDSATRFTVR